MDKTNKGCVYGVLSKKIIKKPKLIPWYHWLFLWAFPSNYTWNDGHWGEYKYVFGKLYLTKWVEKKQDDA